MSRFDILVADTQGTPVTRGNLGPRAVGVHMSTILPGGCGQFSFKIYAPTWFIPDYIGFGFGVTVIDRGDVIWSGRIQDALAHIGPDGEYFIITAAGYGINLDDQAYTLQDVNGIATNVIVSNMITNLTQQIKASTITATGVTLSAATAINLKLLYAKTVANWASQFGDTSNNRYIWHVYPDTDGTVRFTFGVRPTIANAEGYQRDFEMAEMGLMGRQLYNQVIVQYNSAGNTTTVNDLTLQGAGPAGWGFIRALTVPIPEITQSADATQAANAILANVKVARMAAKGALHLKRNAVLRDSNGYRVEPWWLRAGQLFHFRDVIPSQGGVTNLTYNNAFLIAGTDWDEDRELLTLTPESYDTSLETVIARSRMLLTGRNTI